ncbi:MAG TPA: hypothetical protein VFQ53_28955 [Kofleriaceae bacterium]|nr:hypothetical protein [Kofleriaceae bacterium]
MKRTHAGWVVWIAGLALLVSAACGKKSDGPSGPPPEVTGLAAVPSTAEVIIAADVQRLADSPIVERALEQLLVRDPSLAQSWQEVAEGCKIDVAKQIKHVVLVLGPTPKGGRPGTGPVLMVATGSVPETELSACIGKLVGKGGGSVTGKTVAGRTIYQVKDGARVMWFAYGRPDTVVLGTSDAYVHEALSAGKKALDHPELAAWLKQVNQNSPLWAVGRVDERVRNGLVGVAPGLKAGPTAFLGSIDPSEGLKIDAGILMGSPADAKQLESFVSGQKNMIGMAAGLAPVVKKVSITVDGSMLRLKAPLDMKDVNQLLSVLDGGGSAAQDSPPADSPGSGSAPAAPKPNP